MASEDESPEPDRKQGFLGRLFARARPAEGAHSPSSAQADRSGLADPALQDPALVEPSQALGAVETDAPSPEPVSDAALADASVSGGAEGAKRGWWTRLRAGLARSSASLTRGLTDLLAKKKLDGATLDELEDILLRADFGVAAASRVREAVAARRYEKGLDDKEIRAILAGEIERALTPAARPLVIDWSKKPFVILVVGVNGSGKTTTIGKLAAKFVAEGRRVTLAAGDTFRAAAIEQLQIWGARAGAEVISRAQGAEPASLAFDAFKQARASNSDVLIIDTAGRLQNRKELMAELEKVGSVLKKLDPEAPHCVLLVLDATVGQNALSQVEIFGRVAGVTGLVMTKLDGTARGGILVALADRFGLPIHFIGVGESADDLEPFAAVDFARAIVGLEETSE